ncbi:spike base protein, RCAP_Rcc01079 family [Ruegeria atlantica]|uniref:spike base protein, RCAP_Rcc01079 family n=1 Tax=Ruegeria atlantica TaxID=81569 RepID=UPI00147C04A9|nr:hypothetical protein [Ruegeria atlantica]
MHDPFKSGLIPAGGPMYDLVPVTPSDDSDLGFVGVGLYVQGGGDVTFKTAAGETRTIHSATDNLYLPVGVTQVLETGTLSRPDRTWIWVGKPYGA